MNEVIKIRKIKMKCAACKRLIIGETPVIESDNRGVVTHMYHRKCVQIQGETRKQRKEEIKETEKAKAEPMPEWKPESTGEISHSITAEGKEVEVESADSMQKMPEGK